MHDVAPGRLTARGRGWVLAAAGWALVIVVFGVIPTHEVLSSTVGSGENAATSLGHFGEYVVFAFLLAVALGGWRISVKPMVLAAAIAVALGWAIEVVQLSLPYRDFQVVDGTVDMAGVAVGLAAFSVAVSWREARRRARPG
jgi:VanZ family protein